MSREATHYTVMRATHRDGWTVWEHGHSLHGKYQLVAAVCDTIAEAESEHARLHRELLDRVGPDRARLETTTATDVIDDLAYLGAQCAVRGDELSAIAVKRALEMLRDYYESAAPSTHATSRELRRALEGQ